MPTLPLDPVWMDLREPREIAAALAERGGDLTEAIDQVFSRYEIVGDVEGAERFALALRRQPRIAREMETFSQRTRLLFAREVMDELPFLAELDQAAAAPGRLAAAEPDLSSALGPVLGPDLGPDLGR